MNQLSIWKLYLIPGLRFGDRKLLHQMVSANGFSIATLSWERVVWQV